MNGQVLTLPDWSHAFGMPSARGTIRTEIEDFRVTEIPLITPAGNGSHLWMEVEKRGANTDWVARQLAALAGVPARDVGYAGMKDRHGVTSQWFSVALQEAANSNWSEWEIPDVEIRSARLHSRKLKRGALRGNRFRIVVRNLSGSPETLVKRLQTVKARGVPNYFGPQRFGHAGQNVRAGIRWLEQGGRLPRNKRSIYLSAVRSFLFNQCLSRRVDLGNWDRIIDGDIASLDGSHSTFPCPAPDPELTRRCEEFDIHPSGPLPGRGTPAGGAGAAGIEAEVLAPHAALVRALEQAGLASARRPLRLVPAAMAWEFQDFGLVLQFELPAGGYATSVLRELVSADVATISDPG